MSVEKVIQSQQQWLFDEPMNIQFVHVALPSGGASVHNHIDKAPTDLTRFLKEKRSIIQIPRGTTRDCFSRALIIAIARSVQHPRYKTIAKSL